MRILLIHPPWLRFFGRFLASPPIALNSIAAYIKSELPEVEIDIYNADHINGVVEKAYNGYLFAKKHNEYCRRLVDPNDPVWEELKESVEKYGPDIVGISVMTASYESSLQVARIVKSINSEITVVFGGKHPTAMPEYTLKNEVVDIIVIGEGEITFFELLRNVDSLETVKGVAYRDHKGKIMVNGPREYIKNIDALPIPIFTSSFNRYEFEKKHKVESYKWKIVSARGCPFKCIYCASDKKVRYRSSENVVEEVKIVKQNYGIMNFDFQDDSFSLNEERAIKICGLLKKENISWECNTRVDLINDNLVNAFKESGCKTVWIGIESGSENTLKLINKNISEIAILKAIDLLKKYKLFVCGFFMIGFPWETQKDMHQTMELLKRLRIDNFELNIVTPLPGTNLFNDLVCKERINIHKIDWKNIHQGSTEMNYSEYDDDEWRNMMMEFMKSASKIHRRKMLSRVPKLFVKEPIVTMKRLKYQIFD